jgi:hypothetical protein
MARYGVCPKAHTDNRSTACLVLRTRRRSNNASPCRRKTWRIRQNRGRPRPIRPPVPTSTSLGRRRTRPSRRRLQLPRRRRRKRRHDRRLRPRPPRSRPERCGPLHRPELDAATPTAPSADPRCARRGGPPRVPACLLRTQGRRRFPLPISRPCARCCSVPFATLWPPASRDSPARRRCASSWRRTDRWPASLSRGVAVNPAWIARPSPFRDGSRPFRRRPEREARRWSS